MSKVRRSQRPRGRAAKETAAAGRRRRHAAFRSNVRDAAREAEIGAAVTRLLGSHPDVVSLTAFPTSFEWMDGLDGREHIHVPLLLVRREDGSRTYVDAMPRDELEADPELDGKRIRIQLECLARGATHEIWTEADVHCATHPEPTLAIAAGAIRTAYLAGRGIDAPTPPPAILARIADRLGVGDLRETCGRWVGLSWLTGIPTVLFDGLRVDPETRMVLWVPPARPEEPSPMQAPATRSEPGARRHKRRTTRRTARPVTPEGGANGGDRATP